jgi:protein phosphatase
MLDIEFSQFSDTGPTRKRNEDYLGSVLPDTPQEMRTRGWLFAVADGVGGHQQGYVASRTAVESVRDGFRRAPNGEMHTTTLSRLFQQANTKVLEAARLAGPEGTGMATTLVLCALRYDRAVIGHIGDSRCYRIRGSNVTILTNDHTIVNEQQLKGIITLQERDESGICHILSRCLGAELFVSPDITEIQLLPGDILLMCTDGMHNGVSVADIKRIVGPGGELDDLSRQLAEHAMTTDGNDNVTVLMVRIRDVERVGMYRGRPYTLR